MNIDYHLELEHNLYSVPYQRLGEKLEARYPATVVERYRNDRRITAHRRRYGRGKVSTNPEHRPAAHRAHTQWTPSRLIAWAEKSGPATGPLVSEILKRRRHPEQGYRACLEILRWGRRYGDEQLEAACRRAAQLQAHSYRTIKNILSSGFDPMPLPTPEELPAGPEHDNIRGPQDYLGSLHETEKIVR